MKFESTNTKIFPFISIAFLILVDQLSKYLVRHGGGFYICNPDIAFSIGLPAMLFWIVWIIIILTLTILLSSDFKVQISNQYQNLKSKKFDIWILDLIWNNLSFDIWILKNYNFGLVLLLSGALSNILDRLYFSCVIDFIKLPYWPVFNLADTFIVIGVILTVLSVYKNKT